MNTSTKHAHEHAPLIALAWPRILGCTCGWRVPPGVSDSDTAISDHVAIARAAEGASR